MKHTVVCRISQLSPTRLQAFREADAKSFIKWKYIRCRIKTLTFLNGFICIYQHLWRWYLLRHVSGSGLSTALFMPCSYVCPVWPVVCHAVWVGAHHPVREAQRESCRPWPELILPHAHNKRLHHSSSFNMQTELAPTFVLWFTLSKLVSLLYIITEVGNFPGNTLWHLL